MLYLGKLGVDTNPYEMVKKIKKNYFDEEVEQSVIRYLNAETHIEKNKIFHKELYHIFYQMAESICRRYGLFTPNEEFVDIIHDCLNYLVGKLDMFDPSTGKKAFSYYGQIIKNYLMNKRKTVMKNMKIEYSYEEMYSGGLLDSRPDSEYEDTTPLLTELIASMREHIGIVLEKGEFKKKKISDGERVVGEVLFDILGNWEPYVEWGHTKKYDKAVLQSEIKDRCNFDTDEMRKNLNLYRKMYIFVKNKLLRKWEQ